MYYARFLAAVCCAALAFSMLHGFHTSPAFPPVTPHAAPSTQIVSVPSLRAPAFIERGAAWLAAAQFENGGWGAGSHARQDVRDPHAVQVDPATTAFAAMALLRTGSTLSEGPYSRHVGRALDYLLGLVESVPPDAPRITELTGTQPQSKLGQHVDASMVAQFFTEVMPHTRHDAKLASRTRRALEACVQRITRTQDADGSWNSRGGWAGVLQSAMANNALEMADAAGVEVDRDALERSRRYQKSNLDEASGQVRTDEAAGVSLYAISSNQRATAREARKAEDAVRQGVRDGRLAAPSVSEESLRQLGYGEGEAKELAESYHKNKAAADLLDDEQVMAGFGNNGGEEFLSYMMTGEALALQGGQAWASWYRTMERRLSKVQNPDGSWSGHHCITSPVFCTAAVLLALTSDRAAVAPPAEDARG